MASDTDIEAWLNDHQGVVSAPAPAAKAPADADIETWLNTREQSGPQAVATEAVRAAFPSPDWNKPLAPTSSNPAIAGAQAAFQTLRDPTRIRETLAQPSEKFKDLIIDKTGSKTLGFIGQVMADPATYIGGPETGKAVTDAADIGAQALGKKLLAPLGEVLSATRVKNIFKLFKDPMEVLNAPSLKSSGKAMGALEELLQVTPDEQRLIAKAADLATGSSRTVRDQLIKQGQEAATAAGDAAKNWAQYLSPGELIAGRRAVSKLTGVEKGRALYQATQDLQDFEQAFVAKAKDKAVAYLQAIKDNANGRVRDAFLNVVPLNKNMSSNALRGNAMVAETIHNPLLPIMHMPITTGVATLAAKAGYTAAKAVAANPVGRTAIGGAGLAILRNYIQKQRQNPG